MSVMERDEEMLSTNSSYIDPLSAVTGHTAATSVTSSIA